MAFDPNKCMRIIASYGDLTITVQRHNFTGVPIYFSKTGEDGTWVENTITLATGEQAYVKSTGPTAKGSMSTTSFTTDNNYDVKGQITSLLNDGEGGDIALTSEYCFCGLFYHDDHLQTIPEDFLPSTVLSKSCYQELFYRASCLSISPIILPAPTLVPSCYYRMFFQCSNVSGIKVFFTKWEGNSSTGSWVQSVAENGIFYCLRELPIYRGVDSIPSDWAINYLPTPPEPKLRSTISIKNIVANFSR